MQLQLLLPSGPHFMSKLGEKAEGQRSPGCPSVPRRLPGGWRWGGWVAAGPFLLKGLEARALPTSVLEAEGCPHCT